jgi:hypothetical protein
MLDALDLLTLVSAGFIAYGSYILGLGRHKDREPPGWMWMLLGFMLIMVPVVGGEVVIGVIATLFTGHWPWPQEVWLPMDRTLATVGLWLVCLAVGFVTGHMKKR